MTVTTLIAEVTQAHWGRLYALLVSQFNDFELAEDVLQEACAAALKHWDKEGAPDNPAGWLLRVARNRALDIYRRQRNYQDKVERYPVDFEMDEQVTSVEALESFPDERLKLIFTCCHPALSDDAQVLLTLKTLGGLKTSDLARAFMSPETTVAQRIVRAKRKIKAANIPYSVPERDEWDDRISAVLKVIYFIFNEGYTATRGASLMNDELVSEAIFLARTLASLLNDSAEVKGLLALMLFHDARRGARIDSTDKYIGLESQDRRLWDTKKIHEADHVLLSALTMGRVGVYQLQAAISGYHCKAAHFDQTPWQEIHLLYQTLYDLQPSLAVQLNGIVALSYARDVATALRHLDELESHQAIRQYQPYFAVKADLLRRCGDTTAATMYYQYAIDMTDNEVEQAFLRERLASLV